MRPKERVSHDRWQPSWIRSEHLERYRFAAAFVENRVVVDCACGDGTGTRLLVEAGARRVHAFDHSADAIVSTRSATDAATPMEARVADALALPLAERSVDVFVSLETIEHLDDPAAFVTHVTSLLRDDGIFVCSTPNRDVYSPGHSQRSKPWNPFHVREFSVAEFETLLSSAFARVELYGQNARGRFRARTLMLAGRLLPWDLAVRLRQLTKLTLIGLDRERRHRVVPLERERPPEIVVAVCSELSRRLP